MGAKYPQKRPLSARALAEMFGCDPSTVRRKMAQPRAEYLAEHSQDRDKPWLAMGMSRATWFRHGKPMPPPAAEPENEEAGDSPAP